MPSAKPYITGFILSALLTLAAFYFVDRHVMSHHQVYSHPFLITITLILAVTQLVVQLVCFLHLGSGKNKTWNLTLLAATLSLVLIIVIGSIWIMDHLNYNMTPQQMDQYMINDGG